MVDATNNGKINELTTHVNTSISDVKTSITNLESKLQTQITQNTNDIQFYYNDSKSYADNLILGVNNKIISVEAGIRSDLNNVSNLTNRSFFSVSVYTRS